MTPTTAAVIPVSAAVRWGLWRSRSTYGAPRKMNRKHGTNVTHVASSDRDHSGDPGVEGAGVAVGADERHQLHDHDERPRCGLGEGESVHHLAGSQPVVDVDRLLGDVGEDGVRATERDDGGAGEEQPLVDEDAVRGPRSAPASSTGANQSDQPEQRRRSTDGATGRVVVQRVVADRGAAGRRRSAVRLRVRRARRPTAPSDPPRARPRG